MRRLLSGISWAAGSYEVTPKDGQDNAHGLRSKEASIRPLRDCYRPVLRQISVRGKYQSKPPLPTLANDKATRCIGRRLPKWLSGTVTKDTYVDILQGLSNLVRDGALNLACVKRTAVWRIGVLIAMAVRIVLGMTCGHQDMRPPAQELQGSNSSRSAAQTYCIGRHLSFRITE
jgi:hypothetical protein